MNRPRFVEIPVGDEGFSLQARIDEPAPIGGDVPADRPAAVVCHPHPAFGGTMDTPIVADLAAALAAAGLRVLRFNFRGIDGSGGRAEGGLVEDRDVAAACAFVRAGHPARPIVLAGYSFGALMAAKALARGERVLRFCALGLPTVIIGEDPARNADMIAACTAAPTLLLAGDRDQFAEPARLHRFAAGAPGTRVEILPDTDHFPDGDRRARMLAKAVAFLTGA